MRAEHAPNAAAERAVRIGELRYTRVTAPDRMLSFYRILAARALACLALGSLLAGCASCKKSASGGGHARLTAGAGAPIPIPRAHAAYVTNNGSDSISVFDRDGAGGAATSVAVDVDPGAHEAPHHLTVDVARGELFVALAFPPPPGKKKASPHAGHGSASDPGKLARLALDDLATLETRDVDENPGDVVLTHDASKVLVTHFDMKRAMDAAAAGGPPSSLYASLQVWDARTLTLVASRAICVAPHGVVTTSDDKTAVVACYGSDELALVDLTTPALAVARFPLGSMPGVGGAPRYGPYSATLTPDGGRVVVCDLEAQDLRVFDMASRQFVPDRIVTLGARAMMPTFLDPRTVIVPLQAPDGLARVDIDKGSIDARVAFTGVGSPCPLPHVAHRARDGRVYVVCEGDHAANGTVVEVDPRTLAVRKSWTVGVYPDGIALGG
jgi:DNA-binding beta-propeller fold protein YncE